MSLKKLIDSFIIEQMAKQPNTCNVISVIFSNAMCMMQSKTQLRSIQELRGQCR